MALGMLRGQRLHFRSLSWPPSLEQRWPQSLEEHGAGGSVYVGTVPFTLSGEGDGREERKPRGCRAAATKDLATVFVCARQSGDELALV